MARRADASEKRYEFFFNFSRGEPQGEWQSDQTAQCAGKPNAATTTAATIFDDNQ
jgi:hypothetical protein